MHIDAGKVEHVDRPSSIYRSSLVFLFPNSLSSRPILFSPDSMPQRPPALAVKGSEVACLGRELTETQGAGYPRTRDSVLF